MWNMATLDCRCQVSLLRLGGYGGQAGFGCQDRNVSSLTPETRHLKPHDVGHTTIMVHRTVDCRILNRRVSKSPPNRECAQVLDQVEITSLRNSEIDIRQSLARHSLRATAAAVRFGCCRIACTGIPFARSRAGARIALGIGGPGAPCQPSRPAGGSRLARTVRRRNGVRRPPRERMPFAGRIALAMMAFCLMGVPRAGGADSLTAKEQDVKAAFVYNFLKFVEWPANRFQETNAPIVIGVVGESPITAVLETAVQNHKINGRSLVVKVVETPEDARTTLLLFIPASEDKRLGDLLPALAGSGVLTVGESEAFAKHGGIINFVLPEDQVRFEINMTSAERAGLKISAQLQKLARTVRKE
jgi:hypothetical protein